MFCEQVINSNYLMIGRKKMITDGTKVGWPKEITDKITKQSVHGIENYVYKDRTTEKYSRQIS